MIEECQKEITDINNEYLRRGKLKFGLLAI